MSNLSIPTRAMQLLSNNRDSVVPTLVKDTMCNFTITDIYNKQASKEDGRERAIEEFGTEAIWIGGIPFVKKVFDKIFYKKNNANPDFDIRNLKVENGVDRLDIAIKNTKDGAQKEFLSNIKESDSLKSLYKKLYISKFAVATAIPLALLSGLIIFKQQSTNKKLEEKMLAQKQEQQTTQAGGSLLSEVQKDLAKTGVYGAFTGQKNDISFGGAKEAIAEFMFNPLKNQSILDVGITTTRLAQGRKGERLEIGYKELFTIGCYYFLGEPIQKGLEAISKKVFKKPIATEYQLLSNEKLSEMLTQEGLGKSIEELCKKDTKGVMEYVYQNDNALVKMLKISGDIPTVKNSDGVIDSLAFMDTDKIKQGAKNIGELLEHTKGKGDIKKYLSQVKFAKGAAVIANILITVGLVGVVQPMTTIMMRKAKNNGEASNPAFKNIELEMKGKMA